MPALPWHDTKNLLSKLTLRRFWNALKVLAGYEAAKLTRRPVQWGLPIALSFEPTTSCNLRCPECPSGLRAFTRPTGMLQRDFFRQTIDQLAPDLFYLTFYFQGEPYLNPDFLEMVRYASGKKIYTATSTNAHYLTDDNARRTIESGLDRLIISIDGTTQEVYSQYRVGGRLDKVLDGARRIVAWKKKTGSRKPHVIFQFLVVRPNEHQIDDAKALAREIGVDELRFKTAQVYDYENDPNGLIPSNASLSRYRRKAGGGYEPRHRMANHCWRLAHAPVITWDGLVVPCCFDKDAIHRLGDLKQRPFREVWKDAAYVEFRRKMLAGRGSIDICANCSEGARVWG